MPCVLCYNLVMRVWRNRKAVPACGSASISSHLSWGLASFWSSGHVFLVVSPSWDGLGSNALRCPLERSEMRAKEARVLWLVSQIPSLSLKRDVRAQEPRREGAGEEPATETLFMCPFLYHRPDSGSRAITGQGCR